MRMKIMVLVKFFAFYKPINFRSNISIVRKEATADDVLKKSRRGRPRRNIRNFVGCWDVSFDKMAGVEGNFWFFIFF
jgi:hypothetical protein